MTIILGIDPGTRVTGYGLIRKTPTHIEPIDYGCIRPPADLPLAERYLILFTAIETLISRHAPAHVVIESQFVLKNVQTTLKLGGAKTVGLLAAARAKIPVHEYTPTKAKLAVVGTGSASKFQVQQMIQAILRLKAPPSPEDASDALALAICHLHHLNGVLSCTNSSAAALRRKVPSKRSLKRAVSDTGSPSR